MYTLKNLDKKAGQYDVPRYGLMKPDTPYQSTRKDKKAMVFAVKNGKGKVVHFGQKGYKDFRQHKDTQRRKSYLARSAGIRDKTGKLTKNDKFSANYWSRKILW